MKFKDEIPFLFKEKSEKPRACHQWGSFTPTQKSDLTVYSNISC